MPNLNEAIVINCNNQSPPLVVNANRAPRVSWITINIPTRRKKWICLIVFIVLVLLFLAVTGIILKVYLTRKTNITLKTTPLTTATETTTTIRETTTTIRETTTATGTISSKNTCETYLNISLPTAMCHFHSITTADINGDGTIDIIHPDCDKYQINILFNYGNGTFTNPTNYSTGIIPSAVAVGDMNKDGKNDIIITNQFSDSIGIFYNIGNNKFNDQMEYSTDSEPTCVALVDLNEDNYLDIIVAIPSAGNLDIFLNTRNGTFTDQMPYFLDSQPIIITTADVDNDNKLDIIVGVSKQIDVFQEYYIDIFKIDNGNFIEHTTLKTRDTSYSIAVADINGDNAVDIIVANYMTNIEIFFNTGNGTFNTKKIIDSSGSVVTKVAIGDIDGDNRIDIIFASAYSNIIGIFYNIDNGSNFNCLKSFPAYGVINYLTIADINGDKKLDIIVGTPAGILIWSPHCPIDC